MDSVAITLRMRAITDAKTQDKASKVFDRLATVISGAGWKTTVKILGRYEKTAGFISELTATSSGETWSETVLSVIRIMQSIGGGWQISGDIQEELNLHTSTLSVPGIKFVSCRIDRHRHID